MVRKSLSRLSMDTTNPRCLQLSPCTNSPDVCSCPKNNKELCPLSNKCITESVVYQATVTTKDKTTNRPPQTYVGLTENSFKTRLANHKTSFNSFDKRNAIELSKYVWELKNRNIHYTIKWKILKRAKPYNCASNRCNLCLWEKYFIICKPKMATLNKRNELLSACIGIIKNSF